MSGSINPSNSNLLKRPRPLGEVDLGSASKRPRLDEVDFLSPLPLEDIEHIISFLPSAKDVLNFGQTCTLLNGLSIDCYSWKRMFIQSFGGFPLCVSVEPSTEPWVKKYEEQCYWMGNVIKGDYASQITPIKKQEVSAFAVTDTGHSVLGYKNGTVEILSDPDQQEWSVLLKHSCVVSKLICEEDLCVVEYADGTLKAVNLNTREEIPIPQGEEKGSFSKEKGIFIKFSDGVLLRGSINNNILQMWNPFSEENFVVTIDFGCPFFSASVCGATLFCSKGNGVVDIINLRTGERASYFPYPKEVLELELLMPFEVYALSPTKFLAYQGLNIDPNRGGIVYCCDVTTDSMPSYLALFSCPGTLEKFTGKWSCGRLCSYEELFIIFKQFLSQESHMANALGKETVFSSSLFEPEFDLVGDFFAFEMGKDGKFYCLCASVDREIDAEILPENIGIAPQVDSIFVADFAASNEAIAEEKRLVAESRAQLESTDEAMELYRK
jgi:hypothetical protein